MGYVRLTETVRDKGRMLKPTELDKEVKDRNTDWYYSPFTYGEDAMEYFSEHNRSIKGYAGEVYTDTLYWDLDAKGEFEKAREGAIKLVEFLGEAGYGDGLEVFFSGGKGIHVLLHTENKFSPAQTAKICRNVVMKAGVDPTVFDDVVYNVNRIFRYPYTRHQESKLFKVHLDAEALYDFSEEQIREIAANPEPREGNFELVNAANLLESFGKVEEVKIVSNDTNSELTSNDIISKYGSFKPYDCPPEKRRCIYILENGYFGPGERENATIRLAAAYKAAHKDRDEAKALIIDALHKREEVYGPQNKWTESDIDRNIDQVYSPSWNGGTYSCKSDPFLRSKCDLGAGPCCLEHNSDEKLNTVGIDALIAQYIEYGKEAQKDYPKTGIRWIDDNIRIRPRNFSIINGANGSGKTSLLIQILENMNKQGVPSIFFSLDMANTSLFEKLGARYTKYTQRQVEAAFNANTLDKGIMDEVIEAVRKALPLTTFDFTSSVDSNHLERTIRVLKTREVNPINIQVAFVDYAGRVTGDKESEFSNATQVALEANDIAKRTNVHLMYLSQIPREDGDHTEALLSSRVSKHSGAWEENATFIINCWRPFGNNIRKNDRFFHIYIAKNRSGPLGEQVFNWEGKTGTISEMTVREFDDYVRLCQETEGMREPIPQFEQDENVPQAPINMRGFTNLSKRRDEESDEEYASRPPKEDSAKQREYEREADKILREADERKTEIQHSKAAKRSRFGDSKAKKD